MDTQLLNTLSEIIVFLLIFFSFFLLTVKSSKRNSNQFFSFFLLLIALDISGIFLNAWLVRVPIIESLRVSSTLLQLPVLYFYVLSVCYANFLLKAKDGIHTLLFFLFFFLLEVFPNSNRLILIFQIVSEIQYVFYIVLLFLTLKKYKKVYSENYTNATNLNYNWLVQMILVIVIAHLFVLSKSVIKFTNDGNLLLFANIVVLISALIVSSFFVLKALYQPQLFRGIDIEVKPILDYISKEPKEDIKENNVEVLKKIAFIELVMKEKEPFLDADLTIQKLAYQLNLSQKELSTLINHHVGKHFFDFINEYRIRKAMEILKDPAKKEFTVLEILYEVGFNSKSSFNTAFKKHSSLTPVEFRKHYLSGS